MTDKLSLKTPRGRTVAFPTGLFINGKFGKSSDGATLTSINPATGKPLGDVSAGTRADVDRAVEAARKAFDTVWGPNSTPDVRCRALNKWADLIEAHADELGELESLDNGKPVWMARDVDIMDSAGCLRYYAGLADKVEGKTIEQTEGQKLAFTRSEAIGVVGQIIPWNYPIQMFAWKVAPALAAGNTIVLKPAEQTPLSALRLAELSVEAGFPPGVINIVNGLGPIVGQAIAEHEGIDKVAFTGSTVTGKKVAVAAATSNLKRTTLELGGKSPAVVFEDADLEQAAHWVTNGILFNMGQDCAASSRLLVQKSIHDDFVARLVRNFEAHQIGDPFDDKTTQGPQVSEMQYKKILGLIQSGKEQGATVATGGDTVQFAAGHEYNGGYFVRPTIFTGCRKGMRIYDEEIFGPVLCVMAFDDEDDAVRRANDTTYGLGAGIFSENASRCMRMVHKLKAGTVWCNMYLALSNAVPFGGFRQSGYGRELGIEGLAAYVQTKAVHWNYGEKAVWPVTG